MFDFSYIDFEKIFNQLKKKFPLIVSESSSTQKMRKFAKQTRALNVKILPRYYQDQKPRCRKVFLQNYHLAEPSPSTTGAVN